MTDERPPKRGGGFLSDVRGGLVTFVVEAGIVLGGALVALIVAALILLLV